MKYLIILTVFFITGCKAQAPCFNNVNGVNIPCSQADIQQRKIDDSVSVVNHVADSITAAHKAATIATLKTKAYSVLNGLTIGSTLTAPQQTASNWIFLWNTGAINTTTGKIDSTLNYIH